MVSAEGRETTGQPDVCSLRSTFPDWEPETLTIEAERWSTDQGCLKHFKNSVFGVHAVAIIKDQREDMFVHQEGLIQLLVHVLHHQTLQRGTDEKASITSKPVS